MKHGIGNYNYFYCDIKECDYKCKMKGQLESHKLQFHGINNKLFVCNVSGCDYRAKTLSNLNSHNWHKHLLGDKKWHNCGIGACEF